MFQNIMLDKNNLCGFLFGFILGYSVNYYNKRHIQNIVNRLEIVETKNLFFDEDIRTLKNKLFINGNMIKELTEKQESMVLLKKKKRNKIEVQYDDVDFGISTPQ